MIETLLAGSLWLSPGAVSWHAKPGYNERNGGVGIEYQAGRHSIGAGVYKNSNADQSRYLTYGYMPLSTQIGPVTFSAGVAAGVVDGYEANHGGFVPVVLPAVSAQWGIVGVNVVAWPQIDKRSAAGFAVQFKIKVW